MKPFAYRRLWRFYPWYLELIPLVAIVGSIAYTLLVYPSLPDSIVVGLSVDGTVGATAPKSLMRLLYTPGSALLLYVLLTIVSVRRLDKLETGEGELKLPAKLRKKMSKRFIERYRAFSVRSIFFSIVFLVLASALTAVLQIQATLGRTVGYAALLPWLFYFGALGFAIGQYLRTRSVRQTINRELERS